MAGIHLSYSQISSYIGCSKHWQAKYRMSVTDPLGEALIFGSTVHLVFENYLKDKKHDLLGMWNIAWPIAVASEQGKKTAWEETSDTCLETGRRLFTTPEVKDVLDQITPKRMLIPDKKDPATLIDLPMIEREIHLNYTDMPDIVGYIDCVQDDGVPLDFKTAGKMWTSDQAESEMQPLFYLAALEQLGEHDHNFLFRHVVVTKTKNPRIEVFETKRTPSELEFLETVARGVWRGIAGAHFIPNPAYMYCSAKYCGYWDQCAGEGK